jgi:hypothetical protein
MLRPDRRAGLKTKKGYQENEALGTIVANVEFIIGILSPISAKAL